MQHLSLREPNTQVHPSRKWELATLVEILKKIRVIKARNVVSSVELKVYKTTMATGDDLSLTVGDIEGLSEAITDKNMATIAIKYLGIEYETVENLRSKNRGDVTGFNRDVLVKWKNKTQGTTQVGFFATKAHGCLPKNTQKCHIYVQKCHYRAKTPHFAPLYLYPETCLRNVHSCARP